MVHRQDIAWFSFHVNEQERALQREECSKVAAIAHWSSFALILAVLVLSYLDHRSCCDEGRGFRNPARPKTACKDTDLSPSTRPSCRAVTQYGTFAARWRMLLWWMVDDVHLFGLPMGRRDEYIFGTTWFVWLLLLCMASRSNGPSWISHLFSLPQNEALHLGNRFGYVAVSQIPALTIMSSKIVGPMPWFPWWPRQQLGRYHADFGTIIAIFYSIHAAVMLSRFDFERLMGTARWPLWALTLVALGSNRRLNLSKYHFVSVVKLGTRSMVFAMVIWHAPAARIYICEAVFVAVLAFACRGRAQVIRPKTPLALKAPPQTSSASVSNASKTENGGIEQYVWLRRCNHTQAEPPLDTFKETPLSHSELSCAIKLSIEVKPPYLNTVYALLSRFFSSTVGVMPPSRPPVQPNTHAAQFAAKRETPSNERLAIFFRGKKIVSCTLIDEVATSAATRMLIIGGGISGQLAYRVFHDIFRRSPSADVQFVLALGVKSGDWPQPRHVMELHVLESTQDEIVMYGDKAQGVEGSGSNMKTIIDRAAKELEGKLIVLVLGPEAVVREARKHLRTWVMRGWNICLLCINYDKT